MFHLPSGFNFFQKIMNFKQKNIGKYNVNSGRILIIIVSAFAVLTTAQSCTIPNFFNNNTQTQFTLGVLKKGDPKVNTDNFVKANAVKPISGNVNKDGLNAISGIKMIQFDKDTLFLLTRQKGLFKTSESGRLWERKYLFTVGSSESDQKKKDAEINSQIVRNDAFVASDFSIKPGDKDVIYVAGKDGGLGKIYKSTDGGNSFQEVYTEVQKDVGVTFVTVSTQDPTQVFGVLQGGGLIKSVDSGATWQKIRSFKETPVQIGFVPEFNNKFFLLFPTQGLFFSEDNGQNWTNQTSIKEKSDIGESQPKDNLDVPFLDSSLKFGKFEKIVPVIADTEKNSWILLADKQMWYSTNGAKNFSKLVLPLQSEQYNLLDVTPDPKFGLDRILASVDSRLFETKNKGKSWNVSDKITFKIGNIGQIIIDKDNSDTIFLMLADTSNKRSGGLIG